MSCDLFTLGVMAVIGLITLGGIWVGSEVYLRVSDRHRRK